MKSNEEYKLEEKLLKKLGLEKKKVLNIDINYNVNFHPTITVTYIMPDDINKEYNEFLEYYKLVPILEESVD